VAAIIPADGGRLAVVEFFDWRNAIGQSPSELLRAQLEAQ